MATSALVVAGFAGTASANNGGDEGGEGHGSWTPKCNNWEDEEATLDEQNKGGGDHHDGDDCHGGGGGNYPPAPIQIVVPNPVIDYGNSLKAKGKGLCPGVPAIFAVQDNADWTHRYFSPGVPVGADGTAWYEFSPSELAGFYGPITVYVKQFGDGACTHLTTTGAVINKQAVKPAAPATPTTDKDGGVGKPDGGNGNNVPAPAAVTPAATTASEAPVAGITPVVLSAGITAPAAASGSTSAAAASVAADLPVTGSEPSHTLQIALTVLVAGLGMVAVSSIRRRTASVKS
ncbi:MAG: hypothetical protein U0Q03_20265 [Acidimicrobiales bacterium]